MNIPVTLIDAGTGNLRSVHKALESAGGRVTLSSDPDLVARSRRVVLPGVGAFGDFMLGLRASGLDVAVRTVFQRGDPLLGICVGMQAFFEAGEEMGHHPGLGFLTGRVKLHPGGPGLKIPHTGWNQLNFSGNSPLWVGLSSGVYAYFNHAFYCAADNLADIIASSSYGLEFACAVQHGNLFGVQFHPEKSQQVGRQILANFLAV